MPVEEVLNPFHATRGLFFPLYECVSIFQLNDVIAASTHDTDVNCYRFGRLFYGVHDSIE